MSLSRAWLFLFGADWGREQNDHHGQPAFVFFD
jgi:hypothetical protein